MRMTPEQLKEALHRRVQYGEMSLAMCDGACETIDRMQAEVGNIIDHWDQLPADIATDPGCDGLRNAIEATRANAESEALT